MLKRKRKRLANSENFLFFKRLIRNPRSLGAIVPSSKSLARFICRHIDYKPGDYIVEIGAGTGSFTRTILQTGIPSSHFFVVELDLELAKYLKIQFPTLQVIHGNAASLDYLLPPEVIGKVRTVVSGIPMVNLPKKAQKEIIDSCVKILCKEGGILQFTYGPVSPIPAQIFGVYGCKLGRVLQNIPPATVWRYTLTAPLVDTLRVKKNKSYMQKFLLKFQKPLKRPSLYTSQSILSVNSDEKV